MSMEQARALIQRMASDDAFKKQVVDHLETNGQEATNVYLKAQGYDVTQEEIKSALEEMGGEELNEEDLEMVAGGGANTAWAVLAGMGIAAGAVVAGGAAAAAAA